MATIRQQLIELLQNQEVNARDISQILSIREKEVYDHLEHINRSIRTKGQKLLVSPFQCLGCGFLFKDRYRFDRPGRCPHCKEGHIRMATYRIEK